MIENYYSILGVNENSTLLEIKKAFRIKSKQLHPDVNKNLNANEAFILLLEAYEYIINQKTGKTVINLEKKDTNSNSSQHWQDNYTERAKHRAEYYAKNNYKEFEKSEYFKKSTSAAIVFGHLAYIVLFAVFIFLPVYLFISQGLFGLIVSGIIIVVTFPVTRATFYYKPKINLEQLFSALKHLALEISMVIFSIFNILVILNIGLHTLISLYYLVLIFLIGIIITFIISKFIFKKTLYHSKIFAFCFYPFFINLLLAINYFISFNPHIETYSYKQEMTYRRRGTQYQNSIVLENYRYDEYTGIRIFLDYNILVNGNTIKYTFKDGLLGIRVMKDFEILDLENDIDIE